ncbi:MAG TPA: hypothetical protein VHX36_03235 [Candidatus Acidoferrales bacterium]|jgi:nitrogen fixation/metabolism regulation signal transduction histidine kinase|nr:hypothetical protein [Candidatus Acidoferrales bacterium]
MARGWESKSVEDQVQQSETTAAAPVKEGKDKQKRQLTAAQIELHRQREVLILSRVRVQQNLKASGNPRYTEQLNRALADIEAQLAALPEADND